MNMVQNEYPTMHVTPTNPQIQQIQPQMTQQQVTQQFTIPKVNSSSHGQLVPQVIQNADGSHTVKFVNANINRNHSQSLPQLEGLLFQEYVTDGTDSSSESSFTVTPAPSTSQVNNYNTLEAHNSNKRAAEVSAENHQAKKKKKLAAPEGILAQTPPCQV